MSTSTEFITTTATTRVHGFEMMNRKDNYWMNHHEIFHLTPSSGESFTLVGFFKCFVQLMANLALLHL